MTISSLHTQQLQDWVARLQAGDAAARDELLRRVGHRLEAMARRMLRRFPAVHRWEQTDDVCQNAQLRLLRALGVVTPASTQDFFGLAAEQLRRELLDLARRYARRPKGSPGNPATLPPPGDSAPRQPVEPVTPADEPDLERWTAFHQAVEQLPAEQREVVGLVFYHGWTQAQVAEVLGVSGRTVRRWWHDACARLNQTLGGTLPDW